MKILKKQRLSVYLDPDIMKALAVYAARRDQSRSLVAEAAIASFLSPDAAERQEAATTKRLDQLDRRMTRMERDQSAVTGASPGSRTRTGGRAVRSLRRSTRAATREGTESA
jgi:predicted transcriptional regulator